MGGRMKNKTTDYILGMITGIAIMIALYSCTSPLQADESYSASSPTGGRFDPIYVKVVE